MEVERVWGGGLRSGSSSSAPQLAQDGVRSGSRAAQAVQGKAPAAVGPTSVGKRVGRDPGVGLLTWGRMGSMGGALAG
jgi:hypothetical protein